MEFCSIGYLISATTRFLLLSNRKNSRHFVFSRARSRIQLIVGVNYRPRLPLETAQFTIMKVFPPIRSASHTHTHNMPDYIYDKKHSNNNHQIFPLPAEKRAKCKFSSLTQPRRNPSVCAKIFGGRANESLIGGAGRRGGDI